MNKSGRTKNIMNLFILSGLAISAITAGSVFVNRDENFDIRGNAEGVDLATLADLWSGTAVLGERELIVISPDDALTSRPGRMSIITYQGNVYGYFRQQVECTVPGSYECYVIRGGISTDGVNFSMSSEPMLYPGNCAPQGLGAYDPDVIYFNGTFYMAFECSEIVGDGTTRVNVSIATSSEPLSGWSVRGKLVPATKWQISASTPNFVKTPSDEFYLQWVSINFDSKITTRHQALIHDINSFDAIVTSPQEGKLNQSPYGDWDDRNFGSGNVYLEDNYYYMFFEGANNYMCIPDEPHFESRWGIGVARTNNISDINTWEKYRKNPLILSEFNTSCWISYPEIVRLDGTYFMYYDDPAVYELIDDPRHVRTVFRRELVLEDGYCEPYCEGKECGEDDGCGGRCIACPEDEFCDLTTWQCRLIDEEKISLRLSASFDKTIKDIITPSTIFIIGAGIEKQLTVDINESGNTGVVDLGEIPEGEYSVSLKPNRYLSQSVILRLNRGLNDYEFDKPFMCGDLNELSYDFINALDFSTFIKTLRERDLYGDCNNDEVVNAVDYSVILKSYREQY